MLPLVRIMISIKKQGPDELVLNGIDLILSS
jgi:hypothetical protein